jgi:hypothetical protein
VLDKFAADVDYFEKLGRAHLRQLLELRIVKEPHRIAAVKAAIARLERRERREREWARLAANAGRVGSRSRAAWVTAIGTLAAGTLALAVMGAL